MPRIRGGGFECVFLSRGGAVVHRTRQSVGERLCRKFPRETSGRLFEEIILLESPENTGSCELVAVELLP